LLAFLTLLECQPWSRPCSRGDVSAFSVVSDVAGDSDVAGVMMFPIPLLLLLLYSSLLFLSSLSCWRTCHDAIRGASGVIAVAIVVFADPTVVFTAADVLYTCGFF
jgi:hypothetical protein